MLYGLSIPYDPQFYVKPYSTDEYGHLSVPNHYLKICLLRYPISSIFALSMQCRFIFSIFYLTSFIEDIVGRFQRGAFLFLETPWKEILLVIV